MIKTDQYELPVDSIYQSYIQVKNEAKSLEQGKSYWENYTCSIKYQGDSEVTNVNFGYTGTCGTKLLSEIKDLPFTGVRAETTCNPYYNDYESSMIEELDGEATITCAFYRLFIYYGVQDYKLGQTLELRSGFNVFESNKSESAIYAGSSDSFEVFLTDNAYTTTASALLLAIT